jgi:hypothetical protein
MPPEVFFFLNGGVFIYINESDIKFVIDFSGASDPSARPIVICSCHHPSHSPSPTDLLVAAKAKDLLSSLESLRGDPNSS